MKLARGVLATMSLAAVVRSSAVPGGVTDLTQVAATDTSVVLQWTEVPSGVSNAARYLVRFAFIGDTAKTWSQWPNVTTGGCAAPVYGSTGSGGRKRACVLGGLTPRRAYTVQIAAYTGTLNSTAIFGPLSNAIVARTGERVGPMIVQRPVMAADTFTLRSAWIDAYADTFPLRGQWRYGTSLLTGFGPNDSVVARGYLLVVKP